ncbi:DUF309 domain-containing protein [Cryptosporangium minutisporangium]|uniref:DUF309 domain-containing protein n=1 Tax=Cryptosporangium minutisporangium TaxID=113569 RepID=A0ABP6SUW8_9ACTN
MTSDDRDRDDLGRPRQARPRDALGRPLPYGDPRGVPPVSEEPLPPPQALAEAQRLLTSGRAFSAHEVLEAAWKAAPEPERELWQGLAQFCVGLTHAQRGNRDGSARLLARGVARLRPYADAPPHGVDVRGLLDWYDAHGAAPTEAAPPRLSGG